MGHVVHDADREGMASRAIAQGVENARDHGRRELLRAEPVAPPDHARERRPGSAGHRLGEGGQHVLIEGLTGRTRLFRAVEHGHLAHRGRQRLEQRLPREGPEQTDRDHAFATARRGAALHGLLCRTHPGAHDHEDALCVGRAEAVDEPMGPARARRQLVHAALHRGGHGVVERVRGLPGLKEDVGVLGASPKLRPIRVQPPAPVVVDRPLVDEGG